MLFLYQIYTNVGPTRPAFQRVPRTPGILSPKFRDYEFPHAPRRTAFRSLCPSFLADSVKLFAFASRSMLIYVGRAQAVSARIL